MTDNHLETTDLFKSAFLLSMGGVLTHIRIDYNGRRTATFLITGENLDRHNSDYVTGRALVNPVKLKNSLNHLRDQLFTRLNQKESQRYDRKRENRNHQNPNGYHRPD